MSRPPHQLALTDGRVRPLMEVWAVAWPTVLTMTSYTVMQFVDKLMVAQVSPIQFAAQGNGGIWAFTPIGFAYGFLSVVNTYVSQNLGAGTPQEGPKYAWASVWMGLMTWAALLVPSALLLPLLFSRLGHGAELVRLETGYAQILLVGAVVLMVSRGINHFFFGMHRPHVVTVAAIAGNTVNVAANYVLIFGEPGLPALGLPGVPGVPALGVYGAAIGTIIGTSVELLIPAAVFLGPKLDAQLRTRGAWRPRLGPMRDLLRIGWPPAFQWGNEIACWAIFMSVLVGRFGEDHMTAGWAALGWMHLSFMPAIGFSVAATSLVGKYVGAGKPDVAVARARLALVLAVVYMTICGLVFLVFRHPLISTFVSMENVDATRAAEIVRIGGWLMICAAVFQTFDAFGIVYTGALRGAGDTVWPGLVTIIYSWLLLVAGAGAIAWTWPQLQSVGPWIGAAVFIIVYGATMSWRFERGRWRSLNLLARSDRARTRIEPTDDPLEATPAEL